ncbi:MAG: hypothetical protein HRT58_11080 [Crocinitomicaceae bacterium]|nr:hypothetical protein [Flavobacteriales bacterium]NQZ36199.1 hypothetical protein [Crocinitomicaceae bacterium]
MEKDKALLESSVADYFNSIEEKFDYRLRNNWKIETTVILRVISIIFLTFNVVPMLPSINAGYFEFLFDFLKSNFTLPIAEFNFYVSWGVGVIVSLIAVGILYIPYRTWDTRDIKRALKYKLMPFCYAYALRKDIKSYLINEDAGHLEKSVKSFNKVIRPIINIRVVGKDERTLSVKLQDLKTQLDEQFGWVNLTPETESLIKSFESIEDKVIERLKQKIELDKLLPIIDALTLYEFSKLKPNVQIEGGEKLAERKSEYIQEVAKQLDSIENIESLKDDTDKRKRTRIKQFMQNFSNLFSNSNVIVMFISWLILLTVVFVLPTLLLIKAFSVPVGGTILISIASVPFIGAITLVATIYSKNKK